MPDTATRSATTSLATRFRTFGKDGPIYEVLGPGAREGTVAIRVLDTGEELDYRLDRALEDPEAP